MFIRFLVWHFVIDVKLPGNEPEEPVAPTAPEFTFSLAITQVKVVLTFVI